MRSPILRSPFLRSPFLRSPFLHGLALLAGFWATTSCTPSHVTVKRTPTDALSHAKARLLERGVVLDRAGSRVDRLRTTTFCWPIPDEARANWDASFLAQRPVVPFEHEGSIDSQASAAGTCQYLFRFDVKALPEGDGSRMTVQSAWWRARQGACTAVGDPLLGVFRCNHRYEGVQAPANIERFVYNILRGL